MPYGKVWGRVWKGPQLTHNILLCLFWKFQKKSLSLPSENRESNIYCETVTLDRVIDPEQVESLLFYWSAAWGNDDLPGWDEEEHEPVLYDIRIR